MSWSGTVRCGNCWGKGHNKRSCPDLSPRQKELIKPRKCSWCGQAGHTVRKCGVKVGMVKRLHTANREHRKYILDFTTNIGLAPGALLVSTGKSGWTAEGTFDEEYHRYADDKIDMPPVTLFVNEIDWAPMCVPTERDFNMKSKLAVQPRGDYVPQIVMNAMNTADGDGEINRIRMWAGLKDDVPYLVGAGYGRHYRHKFNIVTPGEVEFLQANMPAGWLESKDINNLPYNFNP